MKCGNILVLQRILGHQSLAMTLCYAHLAPEHLQEATHFNPLDKVDTLLTLEAEQPPTQSNNSLIFW